MSTDSAPSHLSPPAADVATTIAVIAELKAIDAATIGPTTSLTRELAFDSIEMLDLLATLERRFDVALLTNLEDLVHVDTPASLTQLVSRRRGA